LNFSISLGRLTAVTGRIFTVYRQGEKSMLLTGQSQTAALSAVILKNCLTRVYLPDVIRSNRLWWAHTMLDFKNVKLSHYFLLDLGSSEATSRSVTF
jgi:hypothetical protein